MAGVTIARKILDGGGTDYGVTTRRFYLLVFLAIFLQSIIDSITGRWNSKINFQVLTRVQTYIYVLVSTKRTHSHYLIISLLQKVT